MQAAVPRHEVAVATGIRNSVRLLGNTIGLAAAGAIVNNAMHSSLTSLGLSDSVVEELLVDPTAINSLSLAGGISPADRSKVIGAYLEGFRGVFYMTVRLVFQGAESKT